MKLLEEIRRKLRVRNGGLEKSKINSLKLKISDAEVEMNKCNHLHVIGNGNCINNKYLICPDCGKFISTEIFRYSYDNAEVINNLSNCLRLYKLIITKYGTSEFNKAAKPYIDMIPYLDNIDTFINVMNDIIADIDVNIDDLLQNNINSNSTSVINNDETIDEYDNDKSSNKCDTNKSHNTTKSNGKSYNNTKTNKKQSALLDKDNFDM